MTVMGDLDAPTYAVVAVFPEAVEAALAIGVVGRARERGCWHWHGESLLEAARRIGQRVDTRPRGGGPGMLLRPDVLDAAIAAADATHRHPSRRVILTADGLPLTQPLVEALAKERALTLVAGRYEGFDDHWLARTEALQVSLGDYVLSGGEPAAAVLLDAVIRLLPGVLGDAESAELDSFSTRLLDYPNLGVDGSADVPSLDPLLGSGNHGRLAAWRREQALLRTLERRPDVLAAARLSPSDRASLRSALRNRSSPR